MQYVVLLTMSIFFGFAFEEFYGRELPRRPGGVRAFPLLSFAGAALYLIEPRYAIAFACGLLVLGAWLFPALRRDLRNADGHGYLMAPVCTVLAYILGPVALTQPMWFTVALTVVTVLLMGSRARLHAIVERVPFGEILTLGQFLLLVGVALPLLANAPAIPFTTITPLKVWLAVVAVSTLSYASYLLQRYVMAHRGILITALLGGMYSSTATTIVLARFGRECGYTPQLIAGTVASTGMMYVRMLVVVAIFNLALGRALAFPLLVLAAVSLLGAALIWMRTSRSDVAIAPPENPLQLGTALLFAALLIIFSQVSVWATAHAGAAGLMGLAAVVGFTDIDPFVLSVAQAHALSLSFAAAAVLVAASSNNVLKALYAVAFSARRESIATAVSLVVLALATAAIAWSLLA